MKPSSTKSANRHRRFPFRLQRIYPSSAPGRTCIVSDSGGSAGGSASGTPARSNRPPSVHPSLSYLPFPHTHLTPYPLSRRRYCSSCTYPTENPRVYGILLIMRSKPNFQPSRLSVTLAMIRTYNDTCPKKRKNSKPNPNPTQTQCKPNPIPIQTLSKPDPNPFQTQFPTDSYTFSNPALCCYNMIPKSADFNGRFRL
jgi:hypothetical protein